jgi:hypothetical protein
VANPQSRSLSILCLVSGLCPLSCSEKTTTFQKWIFSYPQIKKLGDAYSFGSDRKNCSYWMDNFCQLSMSVCAPRIMVCQWETNGKFSVEVMKYASTLKVNGESWRETVGWLHPVSECLTYVVYSKVVCNQILFSYTGTYKTNTVVHEDRTRSYWPLCLLANLLGDKRNQ